MEGFRRFVARATLALGMSLAGCAHDAPREPPTTEPASAPDPAPTPGASGETAHEQRDPIGGRTGSTGEPAPGVGDTRSDETACNGDRSCALVAVGCGAVTAVARDHAAEAAARYERIAAVGECGAMRAPDAVEPLCTSRGCATFPVPNPDVRRCILDVDCMAIDWGCEWTAVARRDEALARELMPVGPGCPGIMPAPPATACIGTFCTFASNVVR